MLNDHGADQLKLMLENHRLFSIEMKGRRRTECTWKPTILTSNFNLCEMCPRQAKSVHERLFNFDVIKEMSSDNLICDLHKMNTEQFRQVIHLLFSL